ncbi:MAG TPA: sugar ABC transporter permease, partial [Solirubrobacteraceae bacterium]|nr:sugar ABC transporter permease [Solirubrobacteraceae bacterium]
SFVVTLAGLLIWQGALLKVLGSTGTVNITDPKVTGLANTFYSSTVSWIIGIGVIVVYAGGTLWAWRQRVSAGLADRSLTGPIVRVVVMAAATIAVVSVFDHDRGLPLAVLILIAFVATMEYVATRTRFGRHVFAVGGNAEAARRAGIRINGVRIAVFAIAGSMAAIGGILAASRLLAVSQNSGGSDLLLLAIAGPVIAGTSLFGGRGSVWTALLGALVIGSISNGMDLLALDSSVKFMVTGGVLLVAVIVDALARRQRQAAGRV